MAENLKHFGNFAVDLESGELWKQGRRVKLQKRPFEILSLLLKQPGKLVTREEIRERLFAPDTHVDFDQSLNTAVNKLRGALGDSAESPRFIETLPGRGYRFIAPTDVLGLAYLREEDSPEKPGGQAPPRGRFRVPLAVTAIAAVLSLVGSVTAQHARLETQYPPPGRSALAVLPFTNLSDDPGQDYFSYGLTEEMISGIGQLQPQRLAVIARTSAMLYKDTQKSIRQIGEELDVDYVLEGSVRRGGERMRITAQLIQVSDQTVLWGQEYERSLEDLLSIQLDVGERVARALELRLLSTEQNHVANAYPIHPEAHEAYLKGRYFLSKRTPQGFEKGLQYFRQALDEAPNYALAHSGVADSYLLFGFYGFLPSDVAMIQAKAAALEALGINDGLAEAHTSLATVLAAHEWNWSAAEREYLRAIELSPNYATAHHWYAFLLQILGRTDEAVAEMEIARKLDPLSLSVNADLGFALYSAREYDEAIEQYQQTLELDPNFAWLHGLLAQAYVQKGMYAEAVTESRKESAPVGTHPNADLAHAQALAGNPTEALKILAELKGVLDRRYFSEATIHVGLGHTDQAFECLEKAYDERDLDLVLLKVDPRFDPLRTDPRFRELLSRMGFPTTARRSVSKARPTSSTAAALEQLERGRKLKPGLQRSIQ